MLRFDDKGFQSGDYGARLGSLGGQPVTESREIPPCSTTPWFRVNQVLSFGDPSPKGTVYFSTLEQPINIRSRPEGCSMCVMETTMLLYGNEDVWATSVPD